MIKTPKYIINVNTLDIDKNQNDLLLNFLNYDNEFEFEFDSERNVYNIFDIKYKYSNTETKLLGDHFFYNKIKKTLYRYDFYKSKLTDQEIIFIKMFMPNLTKFIEHHNITDVTLKIITEIKQGFLDCNTRSIIEGFEIENYIYKDIMSIIKILALLKMFFNGEDEDEIFKINKFLVKSIVDDFYNKKITLDIINKIIQNKMFYNKFSYMNNIKLDLTQCTNSFINDHNYTIMKDLYETKFIYTILDLKHGELEEDFLKKIKED